MASNAEKKKSKPNIIETSIEIVNTGIVQAKEVRLERTGGQWGTPTQTQINDRGMFVWHFLKQRENWLEPFNSSLNFAMADTDKEYNNYDDKSQRYYTDCVTKFQSYDQACLCKVKIKVRKLQKESKESVVHTFELASVQTMKEKSIQMYYFPNYIGEAFFEYRIEIVVKPFLMEKFEPLKISENPIAIPNIEKPAGLKLNGTRCDYEILCQDKKFSCHKAVLATNIKHFEVCTITVFSMHKGCPKS